MFSRSLCVQFVRVCIAENKRDSAPLSVNEVHSLLIIHVRARFNNFARATEKRTSLMLRMLQKKEKSVGAKLFTLNAGFGFIAEEVANKKYRCDGVRLFGSSKGDNELTIRLK